MGREVTAESVDCISPGAAVVGVTRDEEGLDASEEQFRLLVESIEDYAIIMLDREGYVAGWNPGAARMKGYRAEEIIGCHFSLFYPPDLVEAGHPQDELELALAEGSYHEEGERVRKDDTRFWADVTITPVRDQTGELRGFAKVTRDITERKRAEEARLEVEDQFRAAFGDAPIGMALVGRSGRFLRVNQALCALVGYGESELLTKTVGDLTDPAEQAAGDDALRRLFRGELRIFQVERRYRHRYGESVQSMTSVSLVRDRAGSPSYAIAQVQDISERKQAEEVLACRAEQRQALTRLTDIALRSHTLGDLLSELVASVARTLDVEACTVSELSPPQDSLTVVAAAGCADHISASISAISASMWGHTLDEDRPMIVENYATETRFGAPAILADAGVVSSLSAIIAGREQRFGILSAYGTLPRTFDEGQVAFLQDVANLISAAVERLRSEERSRYLALHDVLTGLANRTLAEKNLELALARRRRYGGAVTVFLVDLDGFKVINDSLGHQVGDELLIALASRLRNAVRETDTVARFGGDEFVILAEDGDSPRSSSRIADRLTAAINQPIVLAASEHHMTAAIGIAFAPDNDATPAGLLRDADIAMYRAKSRGRGHRGLFDAQMRAEVTARLRIETDLREAIDNHELCVHYQPIIHQATGRPAAVEALVRWKHSERGFISPAEFIPIAEETGMILALGAMVMEIATTQVAAWQQQFGVPLAVCVNTSAREIANPGFSARVADVVKRNGLSPETLSLEITERVLLKEADTPQGVLTELRAGGVGLMLDDFGTGYSSMSTLQRFQLDTLKIDKSFVDRLGSGPESLAIVQAIIGLARGLQMRIVAEGVETQLQKDTLVELGCDYLQGYLLARPMPADTAESYLRETLIPTAPTQMVGLPGEILR
jgi:diguanylate cyclase (GGDEF)-like protein/PAS domain S-box-containing protein